MSNRQVLVVGGGTMGVDIAASFVAGGWDAVIVNPEDARFATIQARFQDALARLQVQAPRSLTLVRALDDVRWSELDLVIEAVPEVLSLKQQIFAELERLAKPETPLCSNSSALPISAIGKGLKTQQRMVGTHYFMPAHLVPAVEVVCSDQTDPAVADRVSEMMRSVGKVPIRVKKDLPGFLINRLQHAVSREALKLVDQGITTPADVDAAVRFGFGFRYIAAGPCLQRDHAGLDVHHAAAQSIYPDLCNDSVPSEILSERVASGAVGMKAGRGFYDWTPETIAAEKKRYEALLLAASSLLAKEIQATQKPTGD